MLRLTFARGDAGRKFDLMVNGQMLQTVVLGSDGQESKEAQEAFYVREFPLPSGLGTSIAVKFVAHAGSRAGGLYGLRLLR